MGKEPFKPEYSVFKVGLGLSTICLYNLASKTDPVYSRSVIPKSSFKETMVVFTLMKQKFLEKTL